jgi:multidrug efflux pump subunit AcrB
LGGEQEQRSKAVGSLVSNSLLALLLTYTLLAIPLKPYRQPLVIMSVISFGAIGAIVEHYIMDWNLIFFSLLAIIALPDVVVNASLAFGVLFARLQHCLNTKPVPDAGLLPTHS